MNLTNSMNTVLHFPHSMTLLTSNRRWYAAHLYEVLKVKKKRL